MSAPPPVNYAILVDGKTLSWRDDRAIAMEAARYVRSRKPNAQVAVQDLVTGEITPVAP